MADKVKGCDSRNTVLFLRQGNLIAFKDYRAVSSLPGSTIFAGSLLEAAGLTSGGEVGEMKMNGEVERENLVSVLI